MNILKLFSLFILLFASNVYSQTAIKHKVTKGESIYVIAKKYKVSESDIYEANPTIKGKVLQLNTVLSIPPRKDENGNIIIKTHTVASGETLNGIANKYNLSPSILSQLNPNIDAKRLKIGHVLNLTEIPASKDLENFENTPKNAKTHTVSSGESLSIIANKYNLSIAELGRLNPDVDPRKLQIGTVLKLKSLEEISTENNNDNVAVEKIITPKNHIVTSGETLKIIANKYNTSLTTIQKLNPTVDSRRMKIGMVISLPADTSLVVKNTIADKISTNSTPQFQKTKVLSEVKTHRIKSGETFKTIAKKYDINVKELTKLNPKIDPRRMKVGSIVRLNKPDTITILTRVDDQNLESPEILAEDIIHKVLPDETKYGIAKKYGITIEELEYLNPDIKNKLLVDYELVVKRGTKHLTELTPEIIEESKNSESHAVIAEILIDAASKNMGTPYRGGGTTSKGFDCSGLVYVTFKEIDMNLPRSSRGMAKYGEKINKNKAQKGDLIFFATGRKNIISHVGLVTEVNGTDIKFIHSSTSQGVIISSLNEDYYSKRFVQINRVL